jgi:hypothetical protein
VLEPLDLMARLAALVPPPRMHLTRFHGVFGPHSMLGVVVTPAHRGVGGKAQNAQRGTDKPSCRLARGHRPPGGLEQAKGY